LAGGPPVKDPAKSPLINWPTAPYSVILTNIGLAILKFEESVNWGVINESKFCVVPTAMAMFVN
jgi:hypothetical protein